MRLLVSSASSKLSLLSKCHSALEQIPGEHTVLAGDADHLAIASFFDYEFLQMPSTIINNRETISALLREHEVDVVLPTRDGELVFWASQRDFFSGLGITTICSSLKSVNSTLDKLEFFRIGFSAGMPMIHTTEDPTTVQSDRLVVKERVGSGAKSVGLALNLLDANRHGLLLDRPVYQPYVEGGEISVDIWRSKDGRQTFCSPRRRVRVRNGEATITSTFRDERVENLARQVTNLFDVTGPSVLQLIAADDGKLSIVELNPRVGGASSASIESGLPLIELSLRDELGLSTPELQPPSRKVSQIRYPKDLYVDYSLP